MVLSICIESQRKAGVRFPPLPALSRELQLAVAAASAGCNPPRPKGIETIEFNNTQKGFYLHTVSVDYLAMTRM